MKGESLKVLEKIKIEDNGEPLVDVEKFCPQVMIGLGPRRLKKEKTIYIRKTAAKMLKEVLILLTKGYRLRIDDGWRPIEEQRRYYRRFLKKLRKKHPNWKNSRVRREANKWVFPPASEVVPWHLTGGAVDIHLLNEKGRKMSFKYSKNRNLLKGIMEKAGFTSYDFEPWHFSYGDSGWALRNKRKTAIYGKIEPQSLNPKV